MTQILRKEVERDRVAEQPASVEDQRLVQRVLAHWQSWRLGSEFPRRSEFDKEMLGSDAGDCFILDSRSPHPFPVFEFMGTNLAKFSGIFLSGASDWTETLLDKATAHIDEVQANRDAVLVEDFLTRYDGERLAFRCILLPLTDGSGDITHILGAANGKLLDVIGSKS